jgi:hypothetical protein
MILQTQHRKQLSEGRSFGMGYAILKKVDDNYETLNAFTACKDYLNDLVYVEISKTKIARIYGFKHSYTGIFENQDYFYLGLTILDYNNSTNKWEKLDEMNTELSNNINILINNINYIEDKFNIINKTNIEVIDIITYNDKLLNVGYVLKLPIEWIQNPYYISFITLFIRLFFNCSDIENVKDDYKPFIQADSYCVSGILKLFDYKSKNKLFKYPKYDSIPKSKYIHENGCMSIIKN